MLQYETVTDETSGTPNPAGSIRRWTARLPVPGGWLYRTEVSVVIPQHPDIISPFEVRLSIDTTFVPGEDERAPRGTV